MIYKTKGTCSTSIDVELKDGVIDSVKFTGGCNGNLQGISALVKGMKPEVHKQYTGVDNTRILENIKKLSFSISIIIILLLYLHKLLLGDILWKLYKLVLQVQM